MQTTGVARFVDLKLETQHITLIADAQFADSKTKKIRTKKRRKRFIMSAEFFKMIAYGGMIVFLNCIIAGLVDLLFLIFLSDSGDVNDVDKEEVAEKCLILIIVIAVIALITALDGALLYSALSNK